VRRQAIVSLIVLAVLVAAATTAIAYFVHWLPEVASEQRDRIDFLFWLTTGICVGIFAIVAAVIIYAVFKFRVQPDDESDGPPIHGHTGLEIAWTAVPAALVVTIAVASAVVLARNERTGDNPLRVEVTAQQFAWSFKYPNGLSSGTLRLPVDRTVVLRMTARDVIHSFWVPQFGQKQDVVPGIFTELVITPTKVGRYPIVCTELCGLGHAVMRSQTNVMGQGAFNRWLASRGRAVNGQGAGAGAAVFSEQGCGGCHTFTPAKSNGTTGPSLDELDAAARRAGKPLEAFVRESIENPDAYVERGYSKGVMPKFQLTGRQLDGLVQYLAEGSNEGTQ
jgi:cytochrome c oxidase subunit II